MPNIFEQCTTRILHPEGRLEIKCKLGQWGISGGDHAFVEREARHYWLQYHGDGVYADLLKSNETKS